MPNIIKPNLLVPHSSMQAILQGHPLPQAHTSIPPQQSFVQNRELPAEKVFSTSVAPTAILHGSPILSEIPAPNVLPTPCKVQIDSYSPLNQSKKRILHFSPALQFPHTNASSMPTSNPPGTGHAQHHHYPPLSPAHSAASSSPPNVLDGSFHVGTTTAQANARPQPRSFSSKSKGSSRTCKIQSLGNVQAKVSGHRRPRPPSVQDSDRFQSPRHIAGPSAPEGGG